MRIISELQDKNLYYVGGVVRDELLGLPSLDMDYCYEGDAINFARTKKLNIIKENPSFGTVRVLIDGLEIDIASTRTEYYPSPGHLPVVDKIGCSLIDDLKRRDFTINAMAKNTLSGEIIDYFNSKDDLKNKKLRVLHNRSFIDDPSRIIRGLKFSARFGFELDSETESLQKSYISNINYDMSYHRIKKEVKETFNLNSDKILRKFIRDGIYKLLGDNQQVPLIKGSVERLVSLINLHNPWLCYAGLFNLSNFELTKEETEIISSFKKLENRTFDTESEAYKIFRHFPDESVLLWGLVREYDLAYHYLKNLRKIKPSLNGNDLIKLGIERGKLYSEIFDYLTEEKIKNPKLSKEEELKLVVNKYL